MTMSYIEWRTKSIEKMTKNQYKRIKEMEKLGINTFVLQIALQASIEQLCDKDTLLYFLKNQEKCIRDLEE
jgi:hypothetical protein